MAKRVAVVTGGNKGIGYEIVRRLSAEMHTVLTARNEELGRAAVAKLKTANPNADVEFQQLAIDDDESVRRFASWLADTHGKDGRGAIDVLVNNAAIAFKGADPTPFERQVGPTFSVNLYGTLRVSDSVIPLLRPSGAMVFMASQAGTAALRGCSPELQSRWTAADIKRADVLELVEEYASAVQLGDHRAVGWPSSNYGVSKLAVIAMAKVYARELLPRDICVTSCCPGYCATDMSSNRGSRSAADGADTPFWLATAPHAALTPGGFYFDRRKMGW